MENLLNEISETIIIIIRWFKTIWLQFSGYIINANTKVDLAKQSIWKMLTTPGWHTLLILAGVIKIFRITLKKIFKK